MSNVSAFLHIEIVHPDPDSAASFLEDVFDARRVEKNLCDYVEGILPETRLVHVLMGNVVLQLVKPDENLASWKDQLESTGPGVHNISIQVDNMDAIEKTMLERGCNIYSDMVVDLREAGVDCPAPMRALNIDAREYCGLRFEMLPKEYGYQLPKK